MGAMACICLTYSLFVNFDRTPGGQVYPQKAEHGAERRGRRDRAEQENRRPEAGAGAKTKVRSKVKAELLIWHN